MKPVRTIPPAAAPVGARDLLHAVAAGTCSDRVRLAEEIRDYFGCEAVFLVSSGKAALALILMELSSMCGRKKVVIPAYTCYSVPSAIIRAGLEPVPCDVDPDTLDFDYGQLERLVDRDTLCVVSTHLFGTAADVERTRGACRGKEIFVVEDAAQSMGVRSGGRLLGTKADAGFFSLSRGKTITCGGGGVIVTSSPRVAAGIRARYAELGEEPLGGRLRGAAELALMTLFLHPLLYWFPRGLPFLKIGETVFDQHFRMYRLSGFRSRLLRGWRERMEAYNRLRKESGAFYLEALGLRGGRKMHWGEVPYLRFPVYAKDAEAKARACDRYGGLGVSPMYPGPVNRIPEVQQRADQGAYAGAEEISRRLMTLPTHPMVRKRDRERISRAVAPYCDGRTNG